MDKQISYCNMILNIGVHLTMHLVHLSNLCHVTALYIPSYRTKYSLKNELQGHVLESCVNQINVYAYLPDKRIQDDNRPLPDIPIIVIVLGQGG